MPTATVPLPAPRWARRAAHATALCALPSGLWRIAMASGVYVGYDDETLRDVYAVPGWGTAYVVALSVLAELASLFPLLLVTDRRLPVGPRALRALAWTASVSLVLLAVWQLVVAVTVESRTYLDPGTPRTVWVLAFAPLLAVPGLMTAVTWSYTVRHRGRGARPDAAAADAPPPRPPADRRGTAPRR
ncbi:hypothetical protein M4914_05535 [Streptomyces somaliensis DSM 40738]|uniref:hypothetical protein n=1 Tax=Streptomyces somaliensis TaxID=78355 RepID=UPI0021C406DA|nr:hypothetical protein [Streptomyces somaliensis]MCQ0022472.1 hypothetical protein [Streptomyces somaliensis DSM 40738]